jgi:subtilisin family serine protease/streptogramin lyase
VKRMITIGIAALAVASACLCASLAGSVLISSAAAEETAGPAGSPEALEHGGLSPRSFLAQRDADATNDTPVPGRYIVVLKDSVDHPGSIAEAQTEQSGRDLGFVYRSAFKGYSAKLPKGVAEALRRDPRVKYVARDRKVKITSQITPFGVSRIFAPENETLDIDGIDDVRVNADVAVIDTGIDYTHPDLNVVGRIDCTVEVCDSNGTDGNGHGTHVAGTIGAIDNGSGVVGVAPGVRLWAVRVLNNQGEGYDSWILAGIDWVTAHASEIEVANMSIAGYGPLPAENEAISASVDAGVVYSVSAGNDGRNAAGQRPANIPDAITVSALADYDGKPGGLGSPTCNWGPDDSLATFSNWGSSVDIAAPGACVYSTWKGGGYAYDSGTSMAAPHVAGAAAVLASKSNPTSRKDVEAIRQSLVDEGSLAWADASEDAMAEPLLYLGSKPLTGTEVATAGFSNLDGKSVTLNGAVNARGLETEYQFEYGTTTEYGQKAPASLGKLAAGTKYTTVSETISGLKPEQTYHYRLVAKNSSGTIYGPDRAFIPSRWTIQTPASEPVAQRGEWLNSVSCSTKESCMAVGHYYYDDNLLVSYQMNGAQWSHRSMPTPEGEGFSEPDEVSCKTSSTCTAVGKYQTQNGVVVPLIERWNGTSWSIQSISPPYSGAPYSRLRSVSCVSLTECMAVGYYKNSEGTWVNYSARWKNNSWTTLSTPNPAGSLENDLEDVSCTSASSCVAVGWYRPNSGGLRAEIMAWNGSSWTLQASAENYETLYGVSCTSAEFCEAVGIGPTAVTWNGSKWSAQKAQGPAGSSYAYLYDVSCTSPSYCMAVGGSFQGPRGSGLAEAWGGASWKPQTMSRMSEARDLMWGVSCVEFAGCSAVGGAAVGEEDALIESLKDVATSDASNVAASQATLNGTVNPGGLSTTYHFEYGKTPSYGTSVPAPDASAGSGSSAMEVSQELTELQAETTYHYRVVASNAKGTLYGEDESFRTGTVPPEFKFTFGSYGSGNGQLNRPKGIAVDKEGNVWVVDSNNNRVVKFNPKGEYLSKFGTAGTGNGQFATPHDIAFTANGNIWVTDTGNYRVQEFDPSGKYLAQFGSSGTGSGKFTYPKGIAIGPNGHIWVSDYLYRRVEEFSASGEFIRAVGQGGEEQITFSYPDGIAVDSAGSVWVADWHNNRVQELSSTGGLLGKFGIEGEGDGQLKGPSAIDIKPSGDLVITDRSTGRVQQFTTAGEYVTQFGYHNVSEQEGVAVAPNGIVYVSQSNQHGIEKWQQPSPEVVTQAASTISTTGATLTGTVNPRGLLTSYHFEYGPTVNYGNRVPVTNKEVGAGTEAVKVNEAIAGLTPGTTYHFRLVASNSKITIFGKDLTFTSASTAVPDGVFIGNGSAQPSFESEKYPVTLEGKEWGAGLPKFTFAKGFEVDCKTGHFTSSLQKGPQTGISLTPTYGGCSARVSGGAYIEEGADVVTSGCTYLESIPSTSTPPYYQVNTSLFCEEAKPMKVKIYANSKKQTVICTITLSDIGSPGISGTEIENLGSGSERSIAIGQSVNGIHYTSSSNVFCPNKIGEEGTNGTYSAITLLEGFY